MEVILPVILLKRRMKEAKGYLKRGGLIGFREEEKVREEIAEYKKAIKILKKEW